ncbi:hypothetical protein [Shewanella woodyi]|uniref:hypothetical protein n=1 Tax=Shewanella woodyi TaxID=60961 RepID=UPI0007F9546C|nr:hypothetical protein [Shewanella woodyi]
MAATVNFNGDPLAGFGVLDSILAANTSNFSDFASYFTGLVVAPLAAFFALRQWKESQASLDLQRAVTLQELHNAEIQDAREAMFNVQQKLNFMKMNNLKLDCVCAQRDLT